MLKKPIKDYLHSVICCCVNDLCIMCGSEVNCHPCMMAEAGILISLAETTKPGGLLSTRQATVKKN